MRRRFSQARHGAALIVLAWLCSGLATTHASTRPALRLKPLVGNSFTSAPPSLRLAPLRTLPPEAVRRPRTIKAVATVAPEPVVLPPPPPPVQKVSVTVAKSLPPRDVEIETPVLVNDLLIGRVQVRVDGVSQTKAFDYKALRALISDGLAPEVVAELDAMAGGRDFMPFQQTEAYKVPIRFDEDQLATVVTVAPAYTRVQPLQVRAPHRPDPATTVKPAAVSAYVNVRAAAGYDHGSMGAGAEPLRLNLDGAVNLKGWVVEGQGDYVSRNDTQGTTAQPEWTRGNFRLVHDDVAHMLRFAAGDLSYPVTGFQGFQSMLGLSVARNFSLQPYSVFRPTGQSSILLTSPSQVEVFINGNRDRTLHLPAGNYSLSDFPVVDGVNDVHLLITDAAGRVEEHTLSIFTDDNLLRKGVQAFSYNLGLASTTVNNRITYGRDVTFSGFTRYGLTDVWTVGANAQGTTRQQMIGATSVTQGRLGNVQLDLAASHDEASGNGTSGRVQYSFIDPRQHTFDLALSWRDPYFNSLGQHGRALERYTVSARYGQKIFSDIQAAFGARLLNQRSLVPGERGQSQWAYSASFNKYVSSNLALAANFGGSTADHFNFFISLSWIPGHSRSGSQQSVNASYDSASETARADWSWSSGRRDNSLSAQVALIQRRGQDMGLDADADYAGYRYEAGFQHATGWDGASFDQARFASSLVFADGRFALSRPVANSFALIYPHDDLKGHDIGINPTSLNEHDVSFEARADRWGAAVLPDMDAYYDRPIIIDTRHIPAGFDVGNSQVVLAPTYKSGIIVKVGSGADAYARGRITLANGQPAALLGGQVTGTGGYDRQVFTDRNGVFYVYGLARGAYHLSLIGRTGQPLDFTIDQARGKMVDLGTFTLPESHDQVIRQ